MSKSASELFIVDNSESEWKVRNYLMAWCGLSKTIDIATGYFEIGALLALQDKWQDVDAIRILMGDEVSKRTKRALEEGLKKIATTLDASLESEKKANDFLSGVPAVVEALRSGKIQCRVYRKDKFHAKCYLTHGRQAVIGSFGLVGSSNFTKPGLEDNVELNVQIRGNDVKILPTPRIRRTGPPVSRPRRRTSRPAVEALLGPPVATVRCSCRLLLLPYPASRPAFDPGRRWCGPLVRACG